MPSLGDALGKLGRLFREQFDLQSDLDKLADEVSAAQLDERSQAYLQQIIRKRSEIRQFLECELLRYPPVHYQNHALKLREFLQASPYENSVFIMTKFPQGNTTDEQVLGTVISEVKAAILDAGLKPRMAQYGYHDWLWQNVELYLLGCSRGVAIVEDRCRKELNPNVAFEWGWMKGMGKRVFYLMEEKFAHERADWKGLLTKTFSWDKPKEGIHAALTEWLLDKEPL